MDVISFARGVPAPECLPVDELAECARAVLERDGKTILSYGTGAGYSPLRELIADWFRVHPAQVIVTNGGLQGFVLLAERLGRGQTVFVESPTYDRPLKILLSKGSTVVPVEMDDQGLSAQAVEEQLRMHQNPAFLYTIPTFQNPSGRTAPVERRQAILNVADSHGLQIVEDDPYGLVRFEGASVPAYFDLSDKRTIYTSSFSKTIAPGLRVGWTILPPELAHDLIESANSTYISPVLLGQATIYEFISRGYFEPNLVKVKKLLGERRDAMLAALEKHFGGTGAHWSKPEGGYFTWLELPPGVIAKGVLERAQGVTAVLGTDFGGLPGSMRLAYSYVSPDEIDEGVARLAAAVA